MATPDFKDVFFNPDAYRDLLCIANDKDFEGQHFDRKQAGQSNGTTDLSRSELSALRQHIERTISGFANATGGLLIVGISKSGEPIGIGHLSERQKKSLLDLTSLKGVTPRAKVHHLKIGEDTREIAMFMVEADERTFCCRVKDDAAWIRRGSDTFELRGVELEQLKRDRKVVDYERMRAGDFDGGDVDDTVLNEFMKSKDYRTGTAPVEVLRDGGAIDGKNHEREWTNAGLLFFASNPRRVLSSAYLRLLRFECAYEHEDERPTPTFDRDFDGPLTKQIRDFRTFIADSGLFKTYEVRAPDGGFVSEPEYPPIAIDEAVVNAIAHRDYGIGQPIVCEKYEDAFVVKNPGRLEQQYDVPEEFRLSEFQLESRLRNPKLMDWLRVMKDARGAAFVKAIREGTRRMRDEMEQLGLPPPVYINRPAETVVILRNDIKRREARPTGLAADESIESDEYTNLYALEGFDEAGRRKGDREYRRLFLAALLDKLEARGWIIDRFAKGRLIAHIKGAQERLPDELKHVVRLIPAYEMSVRSYFGRSYLALDYILQVQSVVRMQDAVQRFGYADLIGLRAFAMNGANAVRGHIVSVTSDHTTIRDFESGDELTLASRSVYPNLTRAQLDGLVREAAPRFDFAREVKSAALSARTGAARERARRIAAIVSTLRQEIFPLSTSSFDTNLAEAPLRLAENGDGRRALQVRTVREPEVEFSQRRATPNIRDGITKYGSYSDEPRDIELVAVVQPGFEQSMRGLVHRLQVGKYQYKGSERTFSTRLKLAQVSTAQGLSVDEECRRLLDTYPEWKGNDARNRVLLVHTPESGFALDDVSSPYYLAKRVLLEAGIPCQMVDTPTLNNPDYKDLNLALNVVAKTGVAPWVLPESIPDADFFVGLSYTSSRGGGLDERVLGFANVFNRYGRWVFYSGGNEAVPYEARERHYEQLVTRTLSELKLSASPTIYFHYSARFSVADRKAILKGAREVCPGGRFVFVWINRHHPVRLFDQTAGTDGSVARGRYVVSAPNQVILSTTGYNQYRKAMGTPQALELNVFGDPGDTAGSPLVDHRALARQVLSLTKLNWASTDALCGEPITTKYAKDIAYLTAAFERQKRGTFRLHPVLVRTPWFI